MRAPRQGGKKDLSPVAVLMECRMGAGREATPRQAGNPGRGARPPPGISPGPRGYEKLALGRNARRMAHHYAVHTIAWGANGAVRVPPLRPGPENPDSSEIARVCRYALCCGRKGVGGAGNTARDMARRRSRVRREERRKGDLCQTPENYGG